MDAGQDSASTSVIMDSDYVVLDNHTNTIVHPSERTDEPPPASATGASGIRRITSGTNYSSIMERMDIDLAICKANISSLDLQAIQQSSKLEWMQQQLHRAREEKEAMETTIEELTNQVKGLTGERTRSTEKFR